MSAANHVHVVGKMPRVGIEVARRARPATDAPVVRHAHLQEIRQRSVNIQADVFRRNVVRSDIPVVAAPAECGMKCVQGGPAERVRVAQGYRLRSLPVARGRRRERVLAVEHRGILVLRQEIPSIEGVFAFCTQSIREMNCSSSPVAGMP